MKRWHSLLVSLLALIGCGREKAYHAQLKMMHTFEVPEIKPDSLAELMESEEVLLLDVRSTAEQQVSQLPGARTIDYQTFSTAMLDSVSKDTPIVVYCAVGYRSGQVGEQLLAANYQQVLNLYGGILEWKNKGYPIHTPAGEQTEKVHTYSGYWSNFLEKGEAVY